MGVRAAYEGYRLSPQQQRLWTLGDAAGHQNYLAQCGAVIDGPVDSRALYRALAGVAEANEILRTTFRAVPGMTLPVQVIADVPSIGYELLPVTGTGSAAEVCDRLLERHRREPFDLAAGPLLRVTVASLDERRHAVAVTAPSLCADAASLALLLRSAAGLYRGEAAAREAEPPQYADLAEWLNELVESEETEPGRAHWRALAARWATSAARDGDFAGVRPMRPVAPRQPVVTARVGAAASAALDDLAAACGVSQAAIVLACWRLVLSTVAGDGPVVVGVGCPGRDDDDLRDAFGPLENVVPVEFPPAGNGAGTFRELAGTAGSALEEAARWQPYFSWSYFGPSSGLRQEDGPGTWPAAFAYHDAAGAALGPATGLAVVTQSVTGDEAGLRLSCLRYPHELAVTIRCDAETGEPDARRLVDRLTSLLRRLREKLDRPLGEIDLAPPEERAQALRLGKGEPAEFTAACAHELFEAQAARSPDRIALVCGTEQLTFAQLDRRARLLAGGLRRRGVGPDVLVALCLPVSTDLVAAILAIWKAGGAYLPLAVDGPQERHARTLRDAGIRLIVTHSALVHRMPADGADIWCVDQALPGDLAGHGEPTAPPVRSRHLAYAIYTSGSTGGPKGVMIEHRSVALLHAAMRGAAAGAGAGGSSGDTPASGPLRVALNAAVTFDASVQQIVTLFDGHTLHLLPDELRRDDEALAAYVRDAEIDILNGTPTQVEALVAAGLVDAGRRVPGQLLMAGEAVPGPLWSALAAAPTWACNIYGPTECTVNATAAAIATAGPAPVIGRPLPGYEVYVLDERLRPAPLGARGEIFIGGPALARGYLGKPGLTAERFVPHPYAGTAGERLYRTGDIARLREDGQLEFLGRRDGQLKLRGFRIEPGEIEESLRAHPQLRDAVVVADGPPGDRQLVAYVIAAGGRSLELVELRSFLAERLPDYMIPAVFVPVAAFPRTPNGKLDRRALPAPASGGRARAGTAHVPPRTRLEAVLAAIWARTLGTGEVSIDDNFFALGGDSIRAIRVRVQAAERGLSFSIADLFEHQTVRELAAAAASRQAADTAGPAAPFALLDGASRGKLSAGVVDAYPLTRTQAGMVYQSEYHAGDALFCNTRTAHLRGAMNPDALRAALADLAAAHPALRTSFDLTSFSEPVQLVWASATVPLRVDDISALDAAGQEQFIAAFCAAERAAGFRWTEPPFVRLALHRRGPGTFQVTLTMHEAVLDGWSVASLLTELLARYRQALGLASQVPAPPAALHREAAAAELRALADPEQAAFWERYLAGAPARSLPSWPPWPEELPGGPRDGRHHAVTVPVPAAAADACRTLAGAAGLPLKSVLLAVHLYAIGRLTDSARVVTGLVAHRRPEVSDGDRVLGQFLNVLPVRATVSGGSWADLARQAFEAERELLPYRAYPAAHVRLADGRLPPADTAFNFTHFHVYQDMAEDGFERLSDDFAERTDLGLLADFSVDPVSSQIRLTLSCNGLPGHQVAAAARAYAGCMAAIAADPGGSVGGHRWLLSQAPAAAPSPVPDEETVASLFQRQARLRPDACAVTAGTGSLTYRELHQRSAQLARRLVAAGAGPDTLVGVALGRSADLLVTMLAVFTAGAAYFPLDADGSPSQLGRLFAGTGTRLVLTDESHRPAVEAACRAADSRAVLILSVAGDHGHSPATGPEVPAPCRPGQLAYAIGTSGTTGEPKVVLIPQAALVNHLRSKIASLRLAPGDRVAQVAPPTFDVSLWQFLAAPLAGAEVTVLPDDDVADPERLLPALAERSVTVAALVPSLLRAALGANQPPPLPRLRCLLSTGEPLLPGLAGRWLSLYPHTRLVNAYGPAECGDNVSQQDIGPGSAACPIGRPIPGVRIYLLDRFLAPVAAGMPGQICVAGPCLARGYAGNAARTAASFVPDPFVPGERMYLTGDRACLRSDGALEYLGRSDRQVKINGVRVEPDAVEAVLHSHPAVRAAVARAVTDADGTTRLTAYLACGDAPPGAAELGAYLGARLPAPLVPARYVYLRDLPVGAHGKAAEDLLAARLPSGPKPVRPVARNVPAEIGSALARLWAGVLGEPPPTPEHSFFDLGGDSVRAAQLLARIRREFGADLSLRSMLADPTLAGLAALLPRAVGAGPR